MAIATKPEQQTGEITYRTTVREMPSEERPRERLERYGAGTLTNAELLAILLRVGSTRENVLELAARLLREYGGLLAVDLPTLCASHGMGLAKGTQVKTALELARRLNLLTPEARPQIKSPADVANLLKLSVEYRQTAPTAVATLERGFDGATAVLALPEPYRRRLRTTNAVERLNEEVRRRERVIRIFPNREFALRLLGALSLEHDEAWTTGHRYFDMTAYWQWRAEQEAAHQQTAHQQAI